MYLFTGEGGVPAWGVVSIHCTYGAPQRNKGCRSYHCLLPGTIILCLSFYQARSCILHAWFAPRRPLCNHHAISCTITQHVVYPAECSLSDTILYASLLVTGRPQSFALCCIITPYAMPSLIRHDANLSLVPSIHYQTSLRVSHPLLMTKHPSCSLHHTLHCGDVLFFGGDLNWLSSV